MQTQTKGTESERYWADWFESGPTVIDAEEFGEQPVELIDCGVGLWITNVDPILRVRGKKLNLDVNFDVGLVSVSWGVLAKISREDIFRVLQHHVARWHNFENPARGDSVWDDVLSSTSYTARGNVHMGTILSLNKTDMRLNGNLLLNSPDYLG